jgi:hypothetical protein
MTKRDQEVEMGPEIAAGESRPRRPYKTPQLAIYGKLAELTAGENGSAADPGHTMPTRHS